MGPGNMEWLDLHLLSQAIGPRGVHGLEGFFQPNFILLGLEIPTQTFVETYLTQPVLGWVELDQWVVRTCFILCKNLDFHKPFKHVFQLIFT